MMSVDLSSTSLLPNLYSSTVLSWHLTCDMTGRSIRCQDSYEVKHEAWLVWAISVGVEASLVVLWTVSGTCSDRDDRSLWVGFGREMCAFPWLRGAFSSHELSVFATYSSPLSFDFCLTCCPTNAWADSRSASQHVWSPHVHALCLCILIPSWRHYGIYSHHKSVDSSDSRCLFDSSALVSVSDYCMAFSYASSLSS